MNGLNLIRHLLTHSENTRKLLEAIYILPLPASTREMTVNIYTNFQNCLLIYKFLWLQQMMCITMNPQEGNCRMCLHVFVKNVPFIQRVIYYIQMLKDF